MKHILFKRNIICSDKIIVDKRKPFKTLEELNEERKQGIAQALVRATNAKGSDKAEYDYVIKNGVFKQVKKEK